MFRSLRVVIVAAIIAASLAIGGTDATATTATLKCGATKAVCTYGITWE